MSKKMYNLITAITGGIATIAVGVVTYLDTAYAVQINASIVIVETAVVEICNQFVKSE